MMESGERPKRKADPYDIVRLTAITILARIISTRKRENRMITSLEQHGKIFKVFQIIPGAYDGKNRKLLGKFKTSDDAIRFMNRVENQGR